MLCHDILLNVYNYCFVSGMVKHKIGPIQSLYIVILSKFYIILYCIK